MGTTVATGANREINSNIRRFGHGMKPETISAIHDFALNARELLQREVEEQLEGIYAWLPDGKFQLAEKYPAVNELDEAKETRLALEQFVEDEQAAGVKPKDAREKLVKEAAFTWLNRLVAFKMMESRDLIKGTVSKGSDSNAFKLWLVEDGNEAEYEKYELGDLPQNALGEGPRQKAYRHFILWQCGKLAEEIKVLFDPGILASRLFPRPAVLGDLIELVTAPELEEAWAPGNEETIGWIYQYFNEKEKKKVFDRLYKQKKKIKKEDIPAATQLFTPRWIVKFLVQNSLGRMWVQMHPDSKLKAQLDYLVPLAGEIPPVPLKKIKHIRMLDPACGTMHFGLVAFDIFVEMYREEIEKAGSPGWPDEPSLSAEEEIPAAVIANNLYGIEIDLRAVQLSALTLYVKAKSINKNAVITESNLACCDVLQFDDQKLEEFLKESGLSNPIYKRILTALWEQLKDLGQMGSLVRLEDHMIKLIDDEREKFQEDRKQPTLPGFAPDQFESEAGVEEFWDVLETQIIQALNHYAKIQADQGRSELFFTREAMKGFGALQLMLQRYDIVATNPPYMSRPSLNQMVTKPLSSDYPSGKGDLYAAFILRCSEMVRDGGRVAMITQQSFKFISTYEKLREDLRERTAIETVCHLGPRAFDEISGEKVNTTSFIFRSEATPDACDNSVGLYFRLVKEADGNQKRDRLELAIKNLNEREKDPLVFRYRQGDFDAIPGSPWVYWASYNVRELFTRLMPLGRLYPAKEGINTGHNDRFLRFWWEVGFGGDSQSKIWCRIAKGNETWRFINPSKYVVTRDIAQMELLPGSAIRNPGCFFRPGITFLSNSSSRFCAWITSPDHLFCSTGGRSLFPPPDQALSLLGCLNSKVADRLLSLINPTITVKVGDLNRLPVPQNLSHKLKILAERAISLAEAHTLEDETHYEFRSPPLFWDSGTDYVAMRQAELADVEKAIDEEVCRVYGLSEEDETAIVADFADPEATEDILDESENPCSDGENSADNAEPPQLKNDLARMWISYAFGIVMGRFQPGVERSLGIGNFPDEISSELRKLTEPDGALVIDKDNPDDISAKVLQAIIVMLGEEVAAAVVLNGTGRNGNYEESLRLYLERNFFGEHVQKYRKRPVYWFLQSPRKKYGVWIFHERLTKDSLFRIRSDYVEPNIRLLEGQIADIQKRANAAKGKEKRKLEKEIAPLQDVLDDVREFNRLIKHISEVRGYIPHIDDGVLLNMAPLWELVPSWQKEPKKAWEELEAGKYDWSYQAMDHWPDRVREKCKTNKSYAIAHGLLDLYEEHNQGKKK